MTTTDTRSQLLREIAARPDDDTLRLAFADWLDEHGDAADRDRAEFVRVQCELEGMPAYRGINISLDWSDPGFSPECRRAVNLRRRETDLLDAHPEWSRCVCPECEGKGKVIGESIYGYSRERERCLTCGGTGDLFLGFGVSGASKTPPTKPRTVTFARGFADAVTCTLAELGSTTTQHQTRSSDSSFYDEVCVYCDATDARGSNALRGPCVPRFVPTPWAVEVVKQAPVVRFSMTDQTPIHRDAAKNGPFAVGLVWDWSSAHVPKVLMAEMAAAHHDKIAGDMRDAVWWLEFEMEQAATDALALAAGRLVRRHAHKERT